MTWRKWIVRGVVYGIIGAAVGAAVLYQRWTNPGAIREQVIEAVGQQFPGAQVSVDSARLRILGGIQVNGLRLSRHDDPEKHEFLHVPFAIFFHDKEKILDGQLELRKIELFRPRLRVRRGRDGNWNLRELVRKPTTEPLRQQPALVIHQGTLILEDRSDAAKETTLEVSDVSLTLINDPIARISIHGGGASDTIGKLNLHGSIERTSGDIHLAFQATQIPLTQNLASRLPMQCPSDVFRGLELQATANVEGRISYLPQQPEPFFYDVRCEIKNGKLQHPKLPFALQNLDVKFYCKSGELHLDRLTASSGDTQISAHGVGQLPCLEREFEVQLELKHVMLGKDLSERLAPKLRSLHDLFAPRGPMTIQIACARHDGEWVPLSNGKPSRISLRPEGIDVAFKGFPYPLLRATGTIDYNIINQRVDVVDFIAYAGDRPVVLSGHWIGEGPSADVKLDLYATDVTINERVFQALPKEPTNLQAFVRSFTATGKFDIRSRIRHVPGKNWENEYHIKLHDAAIKWSQFPYGLRNVSGFIDVYPRHWEFKQFQGTHRGGHVLVHGKSVPKEHKDGQETFGISLEITGRNVPMDDQLREALKPMPGLFKAWDAFKPSGNLYFTASVERPTPDLKDLKVVVDARGASLTPTFLPYLIEEISGQFEFHDYALDINKLRARHGEATIALDKGKVDLDARGGYYADLTEVLIRGFRLDDDFIRALPPGKLPAAAAALKLHDPLKIATRLVIAQAPETGKAPDVYWDGKAWMYGANFTTGFDFKNVTGELACIGRWNGQMLGMDGNLLIEEANLFDQPFKKAHAKFVMRNTSPDVLLIGVKAPIYSGDVVGQIRVDLNSALRYEMNLTASQINLAEYSRNNIGPKSKISGIASGRLYLHGYGTGLDTMEGNGAIDIPSGHFYNLPVVLELLKSLGQRGPDRTVFEEFHTAFGVQGAKVNVQRIDLLGSAVSLSGKGEFDLQSKNLALDVYPMWGRVEQLVPQQIRPLPTTISKNLLTVEVRGKVAGDAKDVKFHIKPLPVIVDPLLLLRDRVIGVESTKGPELRVPAPDLRLPRLGENR